MKVSHEIPLELLEKSFEFNDYDYFLPTFATNEQYLNHFIEARKRDRFIIMDNGLFENDLKDESTLLIIMKRFNPIFLLHLIAGMTVILRLITTKSGKQKLIQQNLQNI